MIMAFGIAGGPDRHDHRCWGGYPVLVSPLPPWQVVGGVKPGFLNRMPSPSHLVRKES